MNLLWIAPTGSITAPFIPYRIGVQSIAPQFGKHRYLTKGEATRFVTTDWQIQEATEFAGRTFKRLMYYTCDHPDKFLPEVNEALTAFENRMIAEQGKVVETAETLFEADKDDLAYDYLTRYSYERGQEALKLGNALRASIEARTEAIFGFREPEGDVVSQLNYQRVTCLPRD
jgi:dipeptidase